MESPGRVEVGHRARRNPHLGEERAEDLGGQLGSDDLDLLDGLETHLVLGSGVTQRRTGTESGPERRCRGRVHRVGRRVEVDALGIDAFVPRDQLVEA
jgi:hypothetical protein